MILNDNDIQYLAKYRLRNLQAMYGDVTFNLTPDNVISIEFINDYDRNMFTVCKLNLRLDASKKISFLKHKREMSVKMELETTGYDIDIEDKITVPTSVYNLMFVSYYNDDDENTDTFSLEQRLIQNELSTPSEMTPDTENYFETQNTMEMFLFNQAFLKSSRAHVNFVYESGTLQNIVGHLLTDSGHPQKKVLMSKFENTKTYTELLVPNLPFYKALQYLDKYFGFYKAGTQMYYDLDLLYIINANGKKTAIKPNERSSTTFLVSRLEDSPPGHAMVTRPGEHKFYCMISENDLNIQKGSIMQNVEYGSNISVTPTSGNSSTSLQTNTSYIGNKNTVSILTDGEYVFIGETTQARLEENEVIVYITSQNLDMRCFTVNKTFHLVFDETSKHQKYKGNYRLSYATHLLRAASENYMESVHHIVLKKVK